MLAAVSPLPAKAAMPANGFAAARVEPAIGEIHGVIAVGHREHDAAAAAEELITIVVQINGKVRATMEFALDMPQEDIEKQVLASEVLKKWSEGKAPKKVIVVPGRLVNLVI